MKITLVKPISLIIMSWFYLSVGISHFTDTNWFLQIVPPYLPFKLELVYVSGIFEIIFGIVWIFDQILRFFIEIMCFLSFSNSRDLVMSGPAKTSPGGQVLVGKASFCFYSFRDYTFPYFVIKFVMFLENHLCY